MSIQPRGGPFKLRVGIDHVQEKVVNEPDVLGAVRVQTSKL